MQITRAASCQRLFPQAEAMPPNLAPKDSISAGARVEPVKGSEHISEDPSHNNRITDSHGQCTDHRYPAQCFTQPSFAFGFAGHAEGVNGPGTCPTAKAHLTDHPGKADQCHKNKIRDQERSPAIGETLVGNIQIFPIQPQTRCRPE